MQHAEFGLIPIFLVADYALTLRAARLYGDTPDKRAAYELNPRYREEIGRLRPMPVRVMLRYVLMMALLALMCATQHTPIGRMGYTTMVSALIAAYALVDGGHIANILILRMRPGNGEPLTERRRLLAAAYRHFGTSFLPLAVLAAWTPSPFSVGAALGGLYLVATHLRWALASSASALAPGQTVPRGQQPAGQSCGFCGRPATQVPTLIAGKTAGICSDCVTTSAAMLTKRTAALAQSTT